MKFQFQKAVVARLFAALSTVFCGIVSLKLYSNYLTPEVYGVVLVALQILNYLPLVDAGFRTTVNRRLLVEGTLPEKTRLINFCQTFYTLLQFVIVFLATIGMTAYTFTSGVQGSGQAPVFFIILGFVCAVAVIASAQSSLLIGLDDQTNLFLLNGVNSWLNFLALWISLSVGAGVWAFPVSLLAGQLIVIPMAIRRIRKLSPSIRLLRLGVDENFRRYFNMLRSEAWSLFRSQVVTMLLYTFDLILVGVLCGPKNAAVYGVLTRIFAIIRGILQSTGEAAWPIVARKGLDNDNFGNPLLHVNAWVYGAIAGTLQHTLVPLSRWYLGAEWTSPPLIVYLVTARYLITGLATPASYILFGLGEIKTITRCLQQELVIALVVAAVLGWKFGLTGIAVAFLSGTAGGTLFPLIHAYALAARRRTKDVLTQLWIRTLLAFVVSYLGTHYLMRFFPQNAQLVIASAISFGCSIACGLLISALRTRSPAATSFASGNIYRLLKNM
jgi:O-antigen/teichoic acid export membrane protein